MIRLLEVDHLLVGLLSRHGHVRKRIKLSVALHKGTVVVLLALGLHQEVQLLICKPLGIHDGLARLVDLVCGLRISLA